MLEVLQLTRRRNTNLLICLLLVSLLLCCWWLFGLVWTLVLCAAHCLSYCTCCYLCYRLEATKWREALDGWFDHLFIWAFSYHHTPPVQKPSKANGHPASSESCLVGQKSKAESSVGGESQVESTRLSQPVAGVGGTGEGGAEVAPKDSKPSQKCHKEAQKIIQQLMKDFVRSWYVDITSDSEFLEDVQKVLEHVAVEINVRVQEMVVEEVVVELLELMLPYLEVLNKAGCRSYNGGVELFDVRNDKCLKEFEDMAKVSHPALRSPTAERQHYRQALDAMIQTAFPPEYQRCDVACMFVRELLLKNMIEPLFTLLCEPAFLYECIPMVLAKASPEKISRQLAEIQRENEELDHVLNRGRLIVNITGSHGKNGRRFYSNSGHFGQTTQLHKSRPSLWGSGLKRRDFSRPSSMSHFSGLQQTSSGIFESGSWHSQSSRHPPSPLLRSETGEEEHEATYPPSGSASSPRISPIRSHQGQGAEYGVLSGYGDHWDGGYGAEERAGQWPEKEEEVGSEEEEEEEGNTFEMVGGEFAVVELAPIYIERHVRVVRDTGSHIAYIFKFPKWMLADEDLVDLCVLESDTHLEGIKRFSDFNKFHDLLLSSPLSVHIKGLNLPQKRNLSNFISKLPFTSNEPDATMLIERKQGLEKYLQSISCVEAVLTSDLFKKFLKSAVQDLKESNIVNTNRRMKKQHRKSFLGRVKPYSAHMAEPVPERHFESVLSSYLNTHLPLPCHNLNSIHGRKKQRRGTATSSSWVAPHGRPLRESEEDSGRRPHRNSSLSSLGKEHAPPLNSSSTPASSLSSGHSLDHTPSLPSQPDSLHQTKLYEHSSTVVQDVGRGSGGVQTAVEAIDDEWVQRLQQLPDVVHSVMPSIRCDDNEDGSEEEEKHTIGSVSNSLTRNAGYLSNGHSSSSLPAINGHRPTSSPPPSPASSSRSSTSSYNANQYRHSRTSDCHPPHLSGGKISRMDEIDGPRKLKKTSVSRKHDRKVNVVGSEVQTGFRVLLYRVLSFFHWLLSWLVVIIHRGMEPLSRKDSLSLLKEQQRKVPFTNALLCLGSEVSRRHCSRLWACEQDTQLALLVLVGPGLERFLWRELRTVLKEEDNWARSLYVLRHTLWPGGKFRKSSSKKPTEAEVEALKRKAADSFKKFLPNFFPYIVGGRNYDQAVVHCLDCLGNPRITRHFLLSVVDMLMLKLVPQLADDHYQKQLRSLRTRQPVQLETEYEIIS